jgi:hypothetical protein
VGSAQRVRSEATIIRGDDPRFKREMWYSFNIYFPSVGTESDAVRDMINQWYQDGTDETTLRMEQGKSFLEVCPPDGVTSLIKYDLFSTNYGKGTSALTSFQPIDRDTWHEFVFHVIHSTGSDGLIEVWRDGIKIHTITGRNMHLETFPKWKLGIYKSQAAASLQYSRVLYFDNIRVGNGNPNMGGTTPSDSIPPPPDPTPDPTPDPKLSPITSFTLINSRTEKDIMEIADGATISLKQIGAKKLNIRANTASGLGSIKFELSGRQSKTYIDSAIPYALHGDDGKGNYYHGNWDPPKSGTYTLNATPYSGPKGAGTAGIRNKIKFTITN